MAGYSPERAVCFHEAGHAVVCHLLGHRFKSVSIGTGTAGGRFELAPGADPFAPETLEDRAVILLAGGETERCWSSRVGDAPDGWITRAVSARRPDLRIARVLAEYACGGDQDVARTWGQAARSRVLDLTGRGGVDGGDELFWSLTHALAGTLRKERIMTGKEARRMLTRAAA